MLLVTVSLLFLLTETQKSTEVACAWQAAGCWSGVAALVVAGGDVAPQSVKGWAGTGFLQGQCLG